MQRGQVHRHLHPIISCVRGHGQEEFPPTRLPCSIDCVHCYPWYCSSIRDADRHVVITVIWSPLTLRRQDLLSILHVIWDPVS